jgi:hypothetical protein
MSGVQDPNWRALALEPVGDPPIDYDHDLTGEGRWTPLKFGVVWTNDTTSAGIMPLGRATDAQTAAHASLVLAMRESARVGLTATEGYLTLAEGSLATGPERRGDLSALLTEWGLH